MFDTKQELRLLSHTDHICMISTAGVHSNHTGYQSHGAHVAWEAFVRMHPYALNFQRFEIQQWLEDRQINCIHEEKDRHGCIVRTNQMSVMVNRYKRFNERFRVSIEDDTAVNNAYAGKLYALSETLVCVLIRTLKLWRASVCSWYRLCAPIPSSRHALGALLCHPRRKRTRRFAAV